jgi:hypothetical protein
VRVRIFIGSSKPYILKEVEGGRRMDDDDGPICNHLHGRR